MARIFHFHLGDVLAGTKAAVWLLVGAAGMFLASGLSSSAQEPPRFVAPDLPLLYIEGETIHYQIQIEGNSVEIDALKLPEGLDLTYRTLRGTLPSGDHIACLRATNPFGVTEKEFEIRVSRPAWRRLESGTTNSIRASAQGDSFYLLAGNSGYIATSLDGREWQVQNSGTTASLVAAAWGAGRMVVGGANGTALTSVDGQHWSALALPASQQGDSVVYGSSGFVLRSGGTIRLSQDAENWSIVSRPTGHGTPALVASAAGWIVSAGRPDTFSVSPDGHSWTHREGGGMEQFLTLPGERHDRRREQWKRLRDDVTPSARAKLSTRSCGSGG